MTSPAFVPKAGELVWIDFDPSRGREQAGFRPALVISATRFNQTTQFAVVCPITSRVRPFPTSVVLPPGLPIAGEILVGHLRSIDIVARPLRPAGGFVPSDVMEMVRNRLNLFIAG